MPKINEYPRAEQINDDDLVVIDGEAGTRSYLAKNLGGGEPGPAINIPAILTELLGGPVVRWELYGDVLHWEEGSDTPIAATVPISMFDALSAREFVRLPKWYFIGGWNDAEEHPVFPLSGFPNVTCDPQSMSDYSPPSGYSARLNISSRYGYSVIPTDSANHFTATCVGLVQFATATSSDPTNKLDIQSVKIKLYDDAEWVDMNLDVTHESDSGRCVCVVPDEHQSHFTNITENKVVCVRIEFGDITDHAS